MGGQRRAVLGGGDQRRAVLGGGTVSYLRTVRC